MDKAPEAFRTISEVAEELDVPQHVLRFWETRFPQIRPLKRGGGRRYYRPEDVAVLRGIRYLLYGEGYTIRGVQRIFKEQGVRFVMGCWRDRGALEPALNSEAPVENGEREPGPLSRLFGAMARTGRTDPAGQTEAAEAGWATEPVYGQLEAAPSRPFAEPRSERPDAPSGAATRPEAAREAGRPGLSAGAVRRLRAALHELGEIKRILDQSE